MDSLNDLTSIVRRGVDDYGMIDDGDTIAVGLSGGKDSLVLLCALSHLQRYYPKRFELEAFTADIGFEGMDFSPAVKLCEDLGVPFTLLKTNIREIVFDIRKEKNPCSLCSTMRRGALHNAIMARGIKKIALGHHFDDAVETYLMSLIYNGRIHCFRPVTNMRTSGICQIRPMIYVEEKRIIAVCEALSLQLVESTCPLDKDSKRREIKRLIASLEADYPDLKTRIFGAIRRFPLKGWETKVNEKASSL